MRVLMIDDHVMFLQSMKNLLGLLAPQLNIDTADTAASGLRMLAEVRYDLVLLDWHLPDGDGESMMGRLREAGCTARIVLLSGETDTKTIRTSLDLGAAGFIPKRYSSELMLSALDVVVRGGIYLPYEVLTEQASQPVSRRDSAAPLVDVRQRLTGLTPRQIDAYLAAARGLPNKLIARELGIAESTVKTHLAAVYAVLGVHNRTEAAYQASIEGFKIG